jgi:hypothetical protein
MHFQPQASPNKEVAADGAVINLVCNGLPDDGVISSLGDLLKSLYSHGQSFKRIMGLCDTQRHDKWLRLVITGNYGESPIHLLACAN